ncbi:uncharacterized protein LOC135367582 [Ornithodoros turicata]|uniref:uncharacterized protein LOC135367582 n=1 Tax=Ornithodoros turicata TaxID=34597 RepID=UPI003139D275
MDSIFQSMAVPSKRFLMYRSYASDKAFGAAFPCVNIQQTNQRKDDTEASTVMSYTQRKIYTFRGIDRLLNNLALLRYYFIPCIQVLYYNTSSSAWVNYTVPSRTLSSPKYKVPNVIQAGDKKRADSPIMFSDYGKCDVVRAPHTRNEYDCELWVAEQHVNKYPSCCDFIYDLLCAPDKYPIYQKFCTLPPR